MTVKRARKKPVEIDYMEWDGTPERWMELNHWTGGAFCSNDERSAGVLTLEGFLFANVGDMIIRGVKGEFYACKPDIFAKTYDLLEA